MKIALLGSAPSSCGLAPFRNTDYAKWVQGKQESMFRAHGQVPGDFEIWGCSPSAWAQCPRATRWFEVHRWEPGKEWFSPEYCQFLADFPAGKLYTGARIPEIPHATVYPIDRIEEKFSSYFLNSSLSLMLALAIDTIEVIREARRQYESQTDKPMGERSYQLPAHIDAAEITKPDSDDIIGMWGVDMAATEEYSYQRPGCQFFILEAMRRGIKIFLPMESDLMRPMPVYGISEWDHNYIKMTQNARSLSAKAQEHQRVIAEATAGLHRQEGEMAALNSFVHTWTSPYGMKHGMVIQQSEGTGLGSGITHFDGRPISRMTLAEPPAAVMEAMAADPDTALGRELRVRLEAEAKRLGTPYEPAVLLERVLGEAELARVHSALLQPFTRRGESTRDVMKRLVEGAPKAGKKRK